MSPNNFAKIQEAGQKFAESYRILQHSKWELEKLVDSLPAYIAIKDMQNNYLRVNKYLADFCHTTPDRMIGTNMLEWFTKLEADKFFRDDKLVLERGIRHSFVETITNKKDETRIVRTVKVPYKNENNIIIGILLVSLDVEDLVNIPE